jgi:hypothetical protein
VPSARDHQSIIARLRRHVDGPPRLSRLGERELNPRSG